MKRDTVKTFAGLIIIAAIVVATFLYGNSQRQAQLAHDQEVKQQQAKDTSQAKAAQQAAVATTTAQPSNNTAPVKSPTSNSIQGSATSTPKASPTVTASPAVVAGAATTVPVTGATGASAPLPQTGPELGGMLGLGSITAMVVAVRSSRRAMLKSARNHR